MRQAATTLTLAILPISSESKFLDYHIRFLLHYCFEFAFLAVRGNRTAEVFIEGSDVFEFGIEHDVERLPAVVFRVDLEVDKPGLQAFCDYVGIGRRDS